MKFKNYLNYLTNYILVVEYLGLKLWCQKVLKNVRKCQKMSENAEKCQKVPDGTA